MIRFNIALVALAASITSVACGGSQSPAKDPTAADPNAEKTADKPPPGSEPPSLGLGGTGTPPPQGASH